MEPRRASHAVCLERSARVPHQAADLRLRAPVSKAIICEDLRGCLTPGSRSIRSQVTFAHGPTVTTATWWRPWLEQSQKTSLVEFTSVFDGAWLIVYPTRHQQPLGHPKRIICEAPLGGRAQLLPNSVTQPKTNIPNKSICEGVWRCMADREGN